MGDHVFVSYAREDETYVGELASHLGAHGVEVWTDAAVHTGAEWPEAIRKKIDSCAAFVVVMSPDAHRSTWVRREVLHAVEQGKRVFPLLLSGTTLFVVGDLQYEDVGGGGMPSARWVDDLQAAASRPAARTVPESRPGGGAPRPPAAQAAPPAAPGMAAQTTPRAGGGRLLRRPAAFRARRGVRRRSGGVLVPAGPALPAPGPCRADPG